MSAPAGEGLLAGLYGDEPPPPPPPQTAQGRRVTPEEVKTWVCLYACYLDPDVTVDKGRRLPKHKLVNCELPTSDEAMHSPSPVAGCTCRHAGGLDSPHFSDARLPPARRQGAMAAGPRRGGG